MNIEQQLNIVIELQHNIELSWQTISILVIVKSKHSCALQKQQIIKDLSTV